MRPGHVIAQRFELERLAGEGGMGAVWRAVDRLTGARVALKARRAGDVERVVREAQILSETSHPAIVRHVAHGRSEDVGAWVAMEWIEGEDLGARIHRGPLAVSESLALGRRIAGALAALHARGVIHRDVKPTNVMLPGGRVDQAVLLDFGLARVQAAERVTRAGATLGTPGYMSPEQVRGDASINARADVFSLGCVLFECLAGTPVFSGDHFIAVLAKVLMQDIPRLSEVVVAAPSELDVLVARMLSKDPLGRPRDGAALESELAAVAAALDPSARAQPRTARSAPPPSLSELEAQLTSVVLVGGGELADATVHYVRHVGASMGASIEVLGDGSVFGLLAGRGAARDQAAAAARLALALRWVLPGRPCVLATGRTAVSGRHLVGEAIDRASELVRDAPVAGVRVDDATAGLLDARFDVAGSVLRGERDAAEGVRTVLGKPVPCVGRDREMAALETFYGDCVSRSAARAVLLTGVAGAGKSRLLHETLQRLRGLDRPPAVWSGRADPMSAGAPLAIVADALRRVFAIHAGEPLEVRREKVRARVTRSVRNEPERVTWFVGEMVGAPFDEREGVQLASARRDRQLMADQMRRAFEDFVCAELAVRPLVLVLEDLHWGDSASVSFVDSALRLARDQPLLVLVTGRDELRDRFPRLWLDHGVREVRVVDLAASAAAELVRAMLPSLRAERVDVLVERAAGNTLFLEELVRAEAEGRGDATPGSVVAMVTSRVGSLPPELRRVLRASSVFGRTFWRGALGSLLQLAPGALAAHLDALIERELLVRAPDSRFPGDEEYLLRHEIVREAAYRMLTDADRVLAHVQAAKWLEAAGESDGSVLAEHYDKGGVRDRAIAHYVRATQQALDSNDLDAAFARAERGVALGAAWETCGELRSLQTEMMTARGQSDSARSFGELALADLRPGSPAWCHAAGLVVMASLRTGDFARAEALGAELLRGPPEPIAPYLRAALSFLQYGRADFAEALAAKGSAAETPADRFRKHDYRLLRHKAAGDPAAAIAEAELGLKAAQEAGNLRLVCQAQTNLGDALKELGAYSAASAVLAAAVQVAERVGLKQMRTAALHNLGLTRAREGALREGLDLERAAADTFARLGDIRLEGGSKLYLSLLLLDAGDLASAEKNALAAAVACADVPPVRSYARAALSRILLARGRVAEALVAAREAVAFLEDGGRMEEGEGLTRLVWAEALFGNGDKEAAAAAIADARRKLLDRASRIGDGSYRRSFLERVPEHARTVELYGRWCGA
jgi:tetratricopeptide (TPR) repeat protein